MKDLLDRCIYQHDLKKIVYIAIIQSGENEDDESSDEESSDEESSDEESSDEELCDEA